MAWTPGTWLVDLVALRAVLVDPGSASEPLVRLVPWYRVTRVHSLRHAYTQHSAFGLRPSIPRYGVWLNFLSPSRDFARKNTAHAWTDGPPPATFTVR